MIEYKELIDIPEHQNWDIIKLIDKGWSKDKKYFIQNKVGQKFLLRVTDIADLEQKRCEYENLITLVPIYQRGTSPTLHIEHCF